MGCICCEPSAIKESGERKYDGQGTDAEINSTLGLCAWEKLSDYEKVPEDAWEFFQSMNRMMGSKNARLELLVTGYSCLQM